MDLWVVCITTYLTGEPPNKGRAVLYSDVRVLHTD